MEIKQLSPERDLFYWLAVPTVVSAYLTFAMGAVFAVEHGSVYGLLRKAAPVAG